MNTTVLALEGIKLMKYDKTSKTFLFDVISQIFFHIRNHHAWISWSWSKYVSKCEHENPNFVYQLATGWICVILIEHDHMNRFVAGLNFLIHKAKSLEVVKVRIFMFTFGDIYTSKPTNSTMLITNMKEYLW